MSDSTRQRDLPDGWVWTALGDVTQPVSKIEPKDQPDEPFIYLDISSIDNLTNTITEPKIYHGKDAPSRARQLVQTDDVLFSTVRTYLRNIALVQEQYDGQVASTGFCVLRGKPGISGKYLFYYSLTHDFLEELGKLQRGVSYPAVREQDVRIQPIPLAPTAEQQRIVAAIETHFTRLDAAVAALQRVQANLRRYRAAVLKAACEGRLVPTEAELARQAGRDYEPAAVLLQRFLTARRARWEAKHPGIRYAEPVGPDTDGLPELPEGWLYAYLEAFLSLERPGMKTGPFGSLLKKHEHRTNGVPVFGIENIESMKFIPGNKIFVTSEKAEQLSAYDIHADDLLISRSGTVGEICVVPEGIGIARLSTNLMRVVLAPNGLLPKFLVFLFNGTPFVLSQVSEMCSGSTRDFLNQTILSSIVFPVPPRAEQLRIVAEVERRLSVVAEVEAAVAANLARASRLRQAILKQAFAGRLVP